MKSLDQTKMRIDIRDEREKAVLYFKVENNIVSFGCDESFSNFNAYQNGENKILNVPN
jgi:hypothetical protein